MKQIKRVGAAILAGAILSSCFTPGAYAAGPFDDLVSSAWYYNDVQTCCEKGLMKGKNEDKFDPTGMFTLAEALMLAARIHHMYSGGDGNIPAADESDPWYQSAVDYCVKNGIIRSGEFRNYYIRNATRAEVAKIMAASLPPTEWEPINKVTILPDVSALTPYCEAILRLYNAGIFTGSDDYGLFQPYAYITRAEMASIAVRVTDASRRVVLNLLPLSERTIPPIPGGYLSGMVMSNGRLRFQDSSTKRYGFLDANGYVAIPTYFEDAEDFLDGYAVVEMGGKSGVIDMNGKWAILCDCDKIINLGGGCFSVTVFGNTYLANRGFAMTTGGFSEFKKFSDGIYEANYMNDSKKRGLCNADGGVVVPFQYSRIESNGFFFFATQNVREGWDVYDINGGLYGHYDDIGYQPNTQLFKVKEGNKWALADGSGQLTYCVYDDITLYPNSGLALLHVGSARGLGGFSGEIISPFDEQQRYTNYDIVGNYASCYQGNKATSCDLYDTSSGKIVSLSAATGLYPGTFYGVQSRGPNNDIFAVFRDGVFNVKTGVQIPEAKYLIGGIPCISYKKGVFEDANHQFGLYIDEKRINERLIDCELLTDPDYRSYSSEESARIGADDFLSPCYYEIKNNAIRKPCVYQINSISDTETPVLETFRNHMNYDEIRSLGEGFYACRFNTKWYLLPSGV